MQTKKILYFDAKPYADYEGAYKPNVLVLKLNFGKHGKARFKISMN